MGLASLGTDMPNGKLKPGLMIPIPVFPHYKSRIVEFNLYEVMLTLCWILAIGISPLIHLHTQFNVSYSLYLSATLLDK